MNTDSLILNIIRDSKEVIIAINLEGKVILWNKLAENLFGYSQGEVLNKFFPLVNNKQSFELETIQNKSKEGTSISFKTQKQDRYGNELDLIFKTNPIYENKRLIGTSIFIQELEFFKKLNYLNLEIESKAKECKRTFEVIRDLILVTIDSNKKTINQISNESGINWRTVEKHLTYLIGKKLVNEVFSSEYVRIFELTQHGRSQLEELKINPNNLNLKIAKSTVLN